jgi:hypothetical protein
MVRTLANGAASDSSHGLLTPGVAGRTVLARGGDCGRKRTGR